MRPLLLTFPGMEAVGTRLAAALQASAATAGGRAAGAELGVEVRAVELHRFPDGETLVTLPPDLSGRDVAVVATLHDPDPLALPLAFAAGTARELGARRVGLVAPYLAYMRQDRRFAPGQAVSASLYARFLSSHFDWLVTVEPHLHRIARLADIFSIPAERVSAAPAVGAWLAGHVPDAVLYGPDSESSQWVGAVARLLGRPHGVLRKRRRGDFDVDLALPDGLPAGPGTPVILDDIASSGRTMAGAVARLRAAGAPPPVCVVIHAVLAGDAEQVIRAAGAADLVSTDKIAHPTNAIAVGPLIGAALVPLLAAPARGPGG